MHWIVFCISCDECGTMTSEMLFESPPSDRDIKFVSYNIGGMSCIKTFVFEIVNDELTVNRL